MRLRGGLYAADPVGKLVHGAEAEVAVARMIESAGGVCWGRFLLLFSPCVSPAAR
jgi:hypothetical protein